MVANNKSMTQAASTWPDTQYFRQFSMAFAFVLAAEFLGRQLADQLGTAPPLWLMPGIGIAFLWRLNANLWPALFVASVIGMLVSGVPSSLALLHACGTAASTLTVVVVLRTWTQRSDASITTSSSALPYAVGSVVGALVHVMFLALAKTWVAGEDVNSILPTMLSAWLSYVAGALTIGTALMAYAAGHIGTTLDRLRRPENLLLAGALFGLGFTLSSDDLHWLVLLLAAAPLLMLLRNRVGTWGAFLLLAIASIGLGLALGAGSVPASVPATPSSAWTDALVTYAGCLALTLLLSEHQHATTQPLFGNAPDRTGILTLLSEIPGIATIGTDHRGRVTFWSAACTTMYGYSADQVAGRQLDSVLKTRTDLDNAAKPAPLILPSSAESQPPAERIVETADGINVPVFSSQVTLLNSQGEPEYYRIDIDLTELKRLESERRSLDARIQDSQRLESLGLMAGGVAHDFNNMLQAIIGNTDLAMMDMPSEGEARSRLRDVLKTSEQAQELCQQMLAFSGRGKFVVRDIDVSETIRETTPLLQVSLKHSARLHLDLSDELPPVKADSSQIRQLIVNLVANASDALPDDGGDVRVTTYPEILSRPSLRRLDLAESLMPGLYVCFEIVDNGSGMDQVTRKQIFDPFFTTKFTGRGLGLAAALGIVRGHSGAISVESEVGKGSRFRIWLPASATAKEREGDKPVENFEVQSKRPTILITDDEPAVLSSVERILRAADYRALTATSGRSAIEIIHTHGQSISLAIIDLTMPGMDGIEVIKQIREFDQRLPVLLTSGFSEEKVKTHFTVTGPTWFIQKPFRGRNLLDTIESALTKSE